MSSVWRKSSKRARARSTTHATHSDQANRTALWVFNLGVTLPCPLAPCVTTPTLQHHCLPNVTTTVTKSRGNELLRTPSRRSSQNLPSRHSGELKERETLVARLLLLKLLYQYLALPRSVATCESLLPTVPMRSVLEPAGFFLEAPVPLLPSVHFVVPSFLPLGQLLLATAQ